jgi:hypothetical protein
MTSGSTPLGAVGRGAAAGAVGTLAMDVLRYSRHRRAGGRDRFVDWELSRHVKGWEDAPPPAQVGRRLIKGVLQTELPDESAALLNNLMHWATGVQWGVLYGLVGGSTAKSAFGYGALLGSVAWATSYAVLPLAKLYQPIWEYDANTLARDYNAHLVFGFGTAMAFAGLSHGGMRRGCKPTERASE